MLSGSELYMRMAIPNSWKATAVAFDLYCLEQKWFAGEAIYGTPSADQMRRRTCSTYMTQLTNVTEVQAHLRHTVIAPFR